MRRPCVRLLIFGLLFGFSAAGVKAQDATTTNPPAATHDEPSPNFPRPPAADTATAPVPETAPAPPKNTENFDQPVAEVMSREATITHMLAEPPHAGRHTRAELEAMTDEQLFTLHNREDSEWLANRDRLRASASLNDIETQTERILKNLTDANTQADLLASRLHSLMENGSGAAVAAAGGSPRAAGVERPIATNVWVFIAVDDRDFSGGAPNEIALGTKRNAALMKNLLEESCSVDPKTNAALQGKIAKLEIFSGDRFNLDAITSSIANSNIKANDVIFVYVACHGYSFRNGQKIELGFQMPPKAGQSPERVARTTLWSALKSKPARQTILLSDSCATRISIAASGGSSAAPAAAAAPQAFAKLLLYQIGDVDLNGAHPIKTNGFAIDGEVGVYTDAGGYFTRAFIEASKSATSPVSWASLRDEAQAHLTPRFRPPVNVEGRSIFGQTIYLVP